MDEKIKILGIGGSLRKGSYNKALLRTAMEICPNQATYEIFEGLGEFPPYNQDVEDQGIPEVVKNFKDKIRKADALLIATPEYNFGIPGFLKNAIDWASRPPSDNPFNDKPVALMSASTGMLGGARAQYQLRQVFVFLNMHQLNKPEVLVPRAAEKIKNGIVTDEHTREKIKELMESLITWTRKLQKEKVPHEAILTE